MPPWNRTLRNGNAFLHEACHHDEELEREALALLIGQSEASDFLENPAEVFEEGINLEESSSPLLNQSLGPYKILQLLGRGGMGEVYLAEDTRLERKVALKLLPEEFGHDRDRLERFRREAHAASALNHPKMPTIHEIGEFEGQTYLVTEYIEGQTLRQKLAEGRFDLKEALEIGSQIASALAAAHQVGIVHRDLKPENIMLRPDDLVKVLDFGLAKLTPTDVTAAAHTQTGDSAGGRWPTCHRSRREGERVDGRSDLFSLGVVLYEMVAGERPFYGPTSSDTLVAILEREPARLEQHRPGVPEALEQIVAKALAKDPARRSQSAREILGDLKQLTHELESGTAWQKTRPSTKRLLKIRWPRGLTKRVLGLAGVLVVAVWASFYWRDRLLNRVSVSPVKSLAVLPLANLTGDPEQEYLADGMTDELISILTKLSSLKVIARTSVMRYKGTNKPLKTIAKELNVDQIMEGTVTHSKDHVRVTARLIDPTTERNLWAGTYERDLQDVLLLQSELAQSIVRQVKAKITPQEQQRFANVRRINPEAYEAYMRGVQLKYRKTWRIENLMQAINYFQEAIEKEPTFAAAYSGLALWYGSLGSKLYFPSKRSSSKG